MKKLFFASALVLGALCSCSNDDVVAPVVDNGVGEETGLVPVQLTLNGPSVIASVRGIGTVGNTEQAKNLWNGEKLYVFMTTTGFKIDEDGKETTDYGFWPSTWVLNGVLQENFYNDTLRAPKNVSFGDLYSESVEAYDVTKPKFYPLNNSRHDFFAYHIDDAYTQLEDEKPIVDSTTNKNKWTVDFEIDGSQDLMVGKAIPSEDLDKVTAAKDNGVTADMVYSARSARENVIPNIEMKHLLSRFTFQVRGGKNANGLKVTKIEVESKTKGKMTVAYSEDLLSEGEYVLPIEDLIGFDETGSAKYLTLKEDEKDVNGNLLDLKEKILTVPEDAEYGDELPIGESLMVAPWGESYKIKVTTSQLTGDTWNEHEHNGATIDILGGARPGTSYNVLITLYSASEVLIQTTLIPWENGTPDEPIEVNPSDF